MEEKLKDSSTAAITYATIDQLNNETKLRTNADNLILAAVNSLWQEYEDYKSLNERVVNDKQNITDNNLVTNDKTLVGAINEVFRMIQELHNQVVSNN